MPFSAEVFNSDTMEWERVDITTMSAPKLDLAGQELRCPDEDCHAPLIVKHGLLKAPHFAHKAGESAPDCVFCIGGGESDEHKDAKLQIIERIRHHPFYAGATVEPERILRSNGTKRVADVYVELPGGVIEVHEAQLSKTSVPEVQARTEDYHRLGVDSVIWWFGRANANDSSLEQWAIRESGIVGRISFEAERLTGVM